MPVILRKLPFFERPTQLHVRGEFLNVKAYQIILWTSVANRKSTILESNAPRLPVLLDTGLSHNFAIREELLEAWAGLDTRSLRVLSHARLSGLPANLLDADVWLYRNVPGERDALLDTHGFQLQMDSGIAVYPRGTPNAPRLPLLGLRGLRRAELQLHIDFRKCRVFLRTRRMWWFFS